VSNKIIKGKLKVLILSRVLPCHGIGGLENHTLHLAKGLSQIEDIEVRILTTQHPEGICESTDGNINIYYIPNKKPGKYTIDTFRLFHCYTQKLDQIHKFDVIHSQGFAGCLLRPGKSRKIITSPHGTLYSETPLHKDYFSTLNLAEKVRTLGKNLRRIVFRPAYKRLLKISHIIQADSNFIRSELIKELPLISNKIKIVYLGIPEESYPAIEKSEARKKLNVKNDEMIFFSLGRFTPLKGFDLLLKASALIKDSNFHIWIGGSGPYENKLKKLSTELGLKNVKFMGRIPEGDIATYFASADFFVIPEISNPAFGLVALESLLQNTPVIASDAGALPEIISREFGLIFKKAHPQDLAEKMSLAIKNRSATLTNQTFSLPKESPISLRSLAIEKFSFKKMIDGILNLYLSGLSDIE